MQQEGKAIDVLKNYWGHTSFREPQEDIINAVLAGKNVLALLPTGGGKSICFQIPALLKEGICIVVTPLIALMRDQVAQLKKRGIKAIAIHSGLSYAEIDTLLDNCVYDASIKFLYLSPERLQSDLLIERVKKMNVSLLAIDEAHCISEWGFDFRPAYLEVQKFKVYIPKATTIALTASAPPEVQQDILVHLDIQKATIFSISFARANLSYSVFEEENKLKKALEIIKKVSGSGIVYVRSRRNTRIITDYLKQQSIPAAAYHAGMTNADRNRVQDLWINNQVRIIVATSAFGMGIDKPDVRYVIHIDIPESMEAYYQEAGRAGRDGLKAYAILLYSPQDLVTLEEKINQKYPPVALLKKTYQSLANYLKLAVGSSLLSSYEFVEEDFIKTYNLPKTETYHALRRLEKEGFIVLNDAYQRLSRLHITVSHTALYDYQLTHPEMDRFIKAILRLYGGELFSTYLDISEQKIAAAAEIATEDVRKRLSFLHSSNLLVYEPAQDKPQILFATPRYDAERLPIQVAELEKRKRHDLEKLRYVIRYATQLERCRSILLQEYFGEKQAVDCGQCDVCIGNKKKNAAGIPAIREKLIAIIKAEKLSSQELQSHFPQMPKKDFLLLIQECIDMQLIQLDKYGNLEIVISK